MEATTSSHALKSIAFGTRIIGNHKAMKQRFTAHQAQLIWDSIEWPFRRELMICHTEHKGKQYTYLAIIAHQNSGFWPAFVRAKRIAKAKMLRLQADAIEYQMPMEFSIELDELPF